jgi:hypothetical protein
MISFEDSRALVAGLLPDGAVGLTLLVSRSCPTMPCPFEEQANVTPQVDRIGADLVEAVERRSNDSGGRRSEHCSPTDGSEGTVQPRRPLSAKHAPTPARCRATVE